MKHPYSEKRSSLLIHLLTMATACTLLFFYVGTTNQLTLADDQKPDEKADKAEQKLELTDKQKKELSKHTGVRGRKVRRKYAKALGATDKSEKAVDKALQWLAAHQLADGSWNFDHSRSVCNGKCNHAGTYKGARNAATALALLSFFGAGQSHMAGKYQQTVTTGLNYLIFRGKINGKTISWREIEGTHYSHALVVTALCEAYAMPRLLSKAELKKMTPEEMKKYRKQLSRNKKSNKFIYLKLKDSAQGGLNYIMQAQYKDGGWRYSPGTPGDTSVTGWMFNALITGHKAGLRVSIKAYQGSVKYLNSVKANNIGSEFRYMPNNRIKTHATSSIGLLLRMQTTWPHNSPTLADGVRRVGGWGPEPNGYFLQLFCKSSNVSVWG